MSQTFTSTAAALPVTLKRIVKMTFLPARTISLLAALVTVIFVRSGLPDGPTWPSPQTLTVSLSGGDCLPVAVLRVRRVGVLDARRRRTGTGNVLVYV